LLKSGQAALSGNIDNLAGLVRYLSPLANPDFKIGDIKPSRKSFLDLDYLEALYGFRACVSNMQATKQFNELMAREGLTFDQAFNRSAISMVTMAKTHGYLNIVKKFNDTVKDLAGHDARCSEVMSQLAAFFAITNILDGQQWAGLLDFEEISLAEQTITDLCAALRPNAVALVDAFDFPDRVLNSDLGRYDGNVYEALYDFARTSDMNGREAFDGYKDYLRPHLDLDFLKNRSKL
jgi:acyl-CoA oxidase